MEAITGKHIIDKHRKKKLAEEYEKIHKRLISVLVPCYNGENYGKRMNFDRIELY